MKKIISVIVALVMLTSPINMVNAKAGTESVTKNTTIKTGTLTIEDQRLEGVNFSKITYITVSKGAARLKKAMLSHKENVFIFVKSKSSSAEKIYYELEDRALKETEQPMEGDYMRWDISERDVSYRVRKDEGYYWYQFQIKLKYFTTKEQRNQVNTKTDEIIRNLAFSSQTTDYEKVKGVYDYVCNNVSYAKDINDNIVFSSWSALYNGEAVCQGYAQLMYIILKKLKMPVRIIPGVGTDKSVRHGWNIVKLGENYYNLDATWDAQIAQTGEEYRYFLKGDNFHNHTRDVEYKTMSFYRKYPMWKEEHSYDGLNEKSDYTKSSFFVKEKAKIKSIKKRKIKLERIANASGYKIQWSTKKNFKKNTKTKVIKRTNYKLKKLKKGKKYFIRCRAYRKVNGETVHTQWSKIKKIRIK